MEILFFEDEQFLKKDAALSSAPATAGPGPSTVPPGPTPAKPASPLMFAMGAALSIFAVNYLPGKRRGP